VIHEGILRHAGRRYLWWALGLVGICVAIYVTQDGVQPANGGTWQGYVLGTVGALLIVWLSCLGVRKRRYSSALGSLKGWTSAHVYLGAALLVVATLHSAGQLGLNVHTLAYVLMCVVIFSGIFGVYTYASFPRNINATRAGKSRADLFGELFELDTRVRELADKSPDEVGLIVKSAVERTVIGGNAFAQLFGRDESRMLRPDTSIAEEKLSPNRDQQAVIDFISGRIPRTEKIVEVELLQELLLACCRRQAILRRISRDIRLNAWSGAWLAFHIPITIALLMTLVIHIVTTFIYW
jgi:hypothetical protein